MSGWADLACELDAWAASGRRATFWWRDDDAVAVSAPLERLLSLAHRGPTPLALAVIPRDADDALAERLRREPAVTVLQHGFGHDNHAPAGEREQEYGPHRPRDAMIAELAMGRRLLSRFENTLPVMVAPWNRMDEDLLALLPEAGLTAVSTLGPRRALAPATGVRCANVHVDIIDWTGSRGFTGLDRAACQLVDHLGARRRGDVDAGEATGLMTHHLFHDEGCWWFVEELLERTRRHPAARWLTAEEAFWP